MEGLKSAPGPSAATSVNSLSSPSRSISSISTAERLNGGPKFSSSGLANLDRAIGKTSPHQFISNPLNTDTRVGRAALDLTKPGPSLRSKSSDIQSVVTPEVKKVVPWVSKGSHLMRKGNDNYSPHFPTRLNVVKVPEVKHLNENKNEVNQERLPKTAKREIQIAQKTASEVLHLTVRSKQYKDAAFTIRKLKEAKVPGKTAVRMAYQAMKLHPPGEVQTLSPLKVEKLKQKHHSKERIRMKVRQKLAAPASKQEFAPRQVVHRAVALQRNIQSGPVANFMEMQTIPVRQLTQPTFRTKPAEVQKTSVKEMTPPLVRIKPSEPLKRISKEAVQPQKTETVPAIYIQAARLIQTTTNPQVEQMVKEEVKAKVKLQPETGSMAKNEVNVKVQAQPEVTKKTNTPMRTAIDHQSRQSSVVPIEKHYVVDERAKAARKLIAEKALEGADKDDKGKVLASSFREKIPVRPTPTKALSDILKEKADKTERELIDGSYEIYAMAVAQIPSGTPAEMKAAINKLNEQSSPPVTTSLNHEKKVGHHEVRIVFSKLEENVVYNLYRDELANAA